MTLTRSCCCSRLKIDKRKIKPILWQTCEVEKEKNHFKLKINCTNFIMKTFWLNYLQPEKNYSGGDINKWWKDDSLCHEAFLSMIINFCCEEFISECWRHARQVLKNKWIERIWKLFFFNSFLKLKSQNIIFVFGS